MVHMSTEDTRQYAGPPPPPPPSSPPPRGYPPLSAIRRSRTDKHLAGVSGGLARYAGIDPLIIRILFVVLTFFGGTGVLLYAVGWLLLPIEGENESEGQRLLHGRSGPSTLRTVIAGIVAVIVGLILISNLFDEGPGLGGLGAVVVVAAVIVLVARNGQRPPLRPGRPAAAAVRSGSPAGARCVRTDPRHRVRDGHAAPRVRDGSSARVPDRHSARRRAAADRDLDHAGPAAASPSAQGEVDPRAGDLQRHAGRRRADGGLELGR